MRAALAVLIVALLAGCFSGGNEEAALVTVVPRCGPAPTDCGWSMPVQLTVAQGGRRLFDSALGHPTDYLLEPGTYEFALYDKACPAPLKIWRDEHVVITVTLYKNGRCDMTVSPPLRGNISRLFGGHS